MKEKAHAETTQEIPMKDDLEGLLERARHEMTIFDRPSKRTATDMIDTIAALKAELEEARGLPETLPCDVFLPPATCFRKGVGIRSLAIGLAVEGRPSGEYRLIRKADHNALKRLVVAARRASETDAWVGADEERRARFRELDQSAEAFARLVPWDGEPNGTFLAREG